MGCCVSTTSKSTTSDDHLQVVLAGRNHNTTDVHRHVLSVEVRDEMTETRNVHHRGLKQGELDMTSLSNTKRIPIHSRHVDGDLTPRSSVPRNSSLDLRSVSVQSADTTARAVGTPISVMDYPASQGRESLGVSALENVIERRVPGPDADEGPVEVSQSDPLFQLF